MLVHVVSITIMCCTCILGSYRGPAYRLDNVCVNGTELGKLWRSGDQRIIQHTSTTLLHPHMYYRSCRAFDHRKYPGTN